MLVGELRGVRRARPPAAGGVADRLVGREGDDVDRGAALERGEVLRGGAGLRDHPRRAVREGGGAPQRGRVVRALRRPAEAIGARRMARHALDERPEAVGRLAMEERVLGVDVGVDELGLGGKEEGEEKENQAHGLRLIVSKILALVIAAINV